MAIIGGERPSTVHTTLGHMRDEDENGVMEIRTADLEARCAPALCSATACPSLLRFFAQLLSPACGASFQPSTRLCGFQGWLAGRLLNCVLTTTPRCAGQAVGPNGQDLER